MSGKWLFMTTFTKVFSDLVYICDKEIDEIEINSVYLLLQIVSDMLEVFVESNFLITKVH